MPADTAIFEIHLTTTATGTVWHDGIVLAEVMPGDISQFQCRPSPPEQVTVWSAPSVVKVFPDDPPPAAGSPLKISSARNEQEVLQLAMRAGRDLGSIQVKVTPVHDKQGRKLPAPRIHVVGYVPIDYPTSYYRSEAPAWHRLTPTSASKCDGWPGLWPDPLMPLDRFELHANMTQAVWLVFSIPADAVAGDYTGQVVFESQDRVIAAPTYTVHVWDFTLPTTNHVAAIYDIRYGPGGPEQWGGQSLDQMYPQLLRFLVEHRLSADKIRPEPKIRYENGKVHADFRQWDQAAEVYFDELGIPFAYTPWTFYLFGWGHPAKTFFGEHPYAGEPPFDSADRSQLRPEYKKAYQACLKAFWDHVKQKGWADRIVLYISDEPHDTHPYIRQQMKALCDMIHEVDSDIPIYSSTWHHVPDWDGYLDIWGIGHDGRVPVQTMQNLQHAGDRIWFTTDGQMCTDTPYCAVERLLPHYCFHYGAQAYEFWGVSWLTYNPFEYGWHRYIHQSSEPGKYYWVRYPNGDGFLIYPGFLVGHDGPLSSIRLENAREGVEDYEYLYLLRQLLATDSPRQDEPDMATARRALQESGELVELPNAGGRYSSKILPDPDTAGSCS